MTHAYSTYSGMAVSNVMSTSGKYCRQKMESPKNETVRDPIAIISHLQAISICVLPNLRAPHPIVFGHHNLKLFPSDPQRCLGRVASTPLVIQYVIFLSVSETGAKITHQM